MASNGISTVPPSGGGDKHYEISSEIGRGAYGTVYKARDRRNEGAFVALKEISIPTNSEEGVPASTIREIGLLKQLEKYNHPNVVRLLDVCPGRRTHRDMKLMLVFEHVDQDLSQFLESIPSPGLGPDRIRDLMFQIMNGVDFIHSHRIVHRDLKPQNILITGSGQVKLADFGLARVYGFQMALTSVVVTLYYRAPEVLLHDQYCAAVDIWSCGCIFAELHTRRPLFRGSSEVDQLCKLFQCIGLPAECDWPEDVSIPRTSFRALPATPLDQLIPNIEPEACSFLKAMLIFKQTSRISARDALKHDYFVDSHLASSCSSTLSSSGVSVTTSSTDSEIPSIACDEVDDYTETVDSKELMNSSESWPSPVSAQKT